MISTFTCPSFLKSQAVPKKVIYKRSASVISVTHISGLLKKYLIMTSTHTESIIKTKIVPARKAKPSRR
jgi:hypothetical protein